MAYVLNGLGAVDSKGRTIPPEVQAIIDNANKTIALVNANKDKPGQLAAGAALLTTATAQLNKVREFIPAGTIPGIPTGPSGTFVPPPVPGQPLPGGGTAGPLPEGGPSPVVIVGVLAAVGAAVLFLRGRK